MIKTAIRSYIKGLLPKYDKTDKYHSNIVDVAIERALHELYDETFNNDPLSLQRYTKGFGYTTPLEVLSEATTGLYYVTHPVQIIPMPDKASGIRRISTPTQGGMTFFPIDAREMDLVQSGGYVRSVTSKVGYLVTQTRTEFYNMNGTVLASGVRMDILTPFRQYADTDDVLIPEIEMQRGQEAPSFEDRVLKILGVIQAVDQKDDNADKVVKQNNAR